MTTSRQIIIGFSNLDERNPFTVTVRESLQAVAANTSNIRLVVRDNNLDTPTAKRNAQEFADIPVDVAIIFHIDERAGNEIVKPLRDRGIPIIAIDIPIERSIFMGINNEATGIQAGDILAEWINTHWDGKLEKILVLTEYRVLDIFRLRFDTAVNRLEARVPSFSRSNLLYLDNGGEREITAERVAHVLDTWHDAEHIAIISMNDKISQGAFDAIRQRQRNAHVAVLSYDGTDVALQEFATGDTSLVVSPLLDPQIYGQRVLELAIKLAKGEHVTQWNYIDTLPITRENYKNFIR